MINGMDRPDRLEVGTKIATYPADLNGYSGQMLAQQEPPKAEPVRQPETPKQVPPETAKVQVPPGGPEVADANTPPEAAQPVATKPVKTQNIDSGKFMEQNALAIVFVGVAVLLGLMLLMRKKKTARQLDELGDENFAPPTKLNKRK